MGLALITDAESLAQAFQIALFGKLVLQVGLALCCVLFLLSGIGMLKRDERFIHAARKGQYFIFLTFALAAGVLWYMIFEGLFVSEYVYRVSEQQEEFFFKFTALWASQEGSLLFWCLIMSFTGIVFAYVNRHTRTDKRLPATLFVLFGVEIFFLSLMMFERSNPFTLPIDWMLHDNVRDLNIRQLITQLSQEVDLIGVRANVHWIMESLFQHDSTGALLRNAEGFPLLAEGVSEQLKIHELYDYFIHHPTSLPELTQEWAVAEWQDGTGVNPQLHNYWIGIHPPTLYLGYIGFTIPFCYAVGSLISGELDREWIRKARLWTMGSWVFLTAGIAMGGLWAYEILGWGGYWAWDPVENASFIPWLTGTAFIHSVVVQERRGMLKTWNVVLIILTYSLTIIGTFLVRSGIIDSVHAFGDTGLRWPLLIFLIVICVGSLLLVVYRTPLLKADRRLETPFSREGIFLMNNLVLCTIALTTLVMTFWPAITEYLYGQKGKHQFGEEAYTMINAPLFMLLLLLTGLGPLLPYGKNSRKVIFTQLAWPLGLSGLVFAFNAFFLYSNGFLKEIPEDGDFISQAVQVVRIGIQLFLPSILGLIFFGVLQEFLQTLRLRRKSVKQGFFSASLSVLLTNRRRFGGYICHIGVALLALGIYISSFYETDTSQELQVGTYTVVGTEHGTDGWALVHDLRDASPLFPLIRSGQSSSQTVLRAALQMKEDPELSADKLIRDFENAPAFADNPEALSRMKAGLRRAEKIAQEIRNTDRSYEYYQSTLRIFPFTPEPLTQKEAQEFMQLRKKALEELPSQGPELSESFQLLLQKAYTYGPNLLELLRSLEDNAQPEILDQVRGFNRLVRNELFQLEEDTSYELCTKLAENPEDKDAREKLLNLSWRALGGLRLAEAEAPQKTRKTAQEYLARILSNSNSVQPRIKIFYDKKTGSPRPLGEDVRDPQIKKYLSEEVYVILQAVNFGDDPTGKDDRGIFRIFIKPGMNFGLLGLVIIIAGAVFALLPGRSGKIKKKISIQNEI